MRDFFGRGNWAEMKQPKAGWCEMNFNGNGHFGPTSVATSGPNTSFDILSHSVLSPGLSTEQPRLTWSARTGFPSRKAGAGCLGLQGHCRIVVGVFVQTGAKPNCHQCCPSC